MPVKPDSRMVGSAGKRDKRFLVVVMSAFNLPSARKPMVVVGVANIMSMVPPTKSSTAGGSLL